MENHNPAESFEKCYYAELRRRALAPAVGASALSGELPYGYEKRRRDELVDGIAEAIPGIVTNTRKYEQINGILVAENGQPFNELLQNGYRHAVNHASRDDFYFNFWPERASHEVHEAAEWQQMADGITSHNTLITFSAHSEEFLSPPTIDKLEVAGQDPKNKRAMIRIGHWDGTALHVITRSIDNSSLEVLREVSKRSNGYEFIAGNSTEMLGERQRQNMNINQAYELAERIVDEADGLISMGLGQETRQGRPIYEAKDTQKYVESQEAIINELLSISEKLALQHNRYELYEKAWHAALHKHTALIKERMLRGSYEDVIDIWRAAEAAGAIAAARGETYNMCGLIISASGETQPGQNTGFESIKSLYGKKVQCPECNEKVIVPSSKLEDGKLCCPECKYEVDICTGKVLHQAKKRSLSKPAESKKETDWQRIVREDEEKKLRRKLERQQAERTIKAT